MNKLASTFRNAILNAHDGATCHWTLTDAGSKLKGPCDCPSTRPCDQHHMIKCASTKDVLGDTSTASEAHYSKTLDDLAEAIDTLDEIASKADEMLTNLKKTDGTTAKAMADSVFESWTRSRLMSDRDTLVKAMDAALDMLAVPAATDPKGSCVCYENKEKRRRQLRLQTALLVAELRKMDTALEEAWTDIDPQKMHWTDIAEILVHIADIGALATEFSTAGLGILIAGTVGPWLAEKLTGNIGADSYVFLMALRESAHWKATAIMSIIYHDQMTRALTCQAVPAGAAHGGSGHEAPPKQGDPQPKQGEPQPKPGNPPPKENIPKPTNPPPKENIPKPANPPPKENIPKPKPANPPPKQN